MKCWSIVVLVVGILSFGARWKIKNAGSGHLGVVKAFLMFEKHGKYGRSTAEEIVEQKGGNFKDTVSIVTGVSWNAWLDKGKHMLIMGVYEKRRIIAALRVKISPFVIIHPPPSQQAQSHATTSGQHWSGTRDRPRHREKWRHCCDGMQNPQPLRKWEGQNKRRS